MDFSAKKAQTYRKFFYKGGLGRSLYRTRNQREREAVTHGRLYRLAKLSRKKFLLPKMGPIERKRNFGPIDYRNFVKRGKENAARVITKALRQFGQRKRGGIQLTKGTVSRIRTRKAMDNKFGRDIGRLISSYRFKT